MLPDDLRSNPAMQKVKLLKTDVLMILIRKGTSCGQYLPDIMGKKKKKKLNETIL